MSSKTHFLYQTCLPSFGQALLHAAETSLKFTNGKVSYPDFCNAYDQSLNRLRSSNNERDQETSRWVGRKIYALPEIFAGVIKTIYHLALALFGTPIKGMTS